MSLALATVLYEWRRYLAAMIALAFAGLLVLAQVGMFVGMTKSFTATIDRSPADLMILPPKAESMVNTGGMPRRLMPLVFKNPAVIDVADVDDDQGSFSNLAKGLKKKRSYVSLVAIDTQPHALTLPVDIPEPTRLALSAPYQVAVDRSALKQLGVKLGDKAAIDGHAVTVAALLDNYSNINAPQVMISRKTLRLLGKARPSNRVGPMLVRIADPSRAIAVRDELNQMAKGQFRAWTKPELSKANETALLQEQIIGIFLGFSAFIGLCIGIAITSQTLRGAILANIKEFASLRALGVSMGALRLIVLEISLWVGIAGLGATAILVGGVAALARAANVPMGFPLPIVLGMAVFLLVVSLLSGLASLGVLKRSQPADLLR